MLPSLLLLQSIKNSINLTSTTGKLKLLWLQAISIHSKSIFILIQLAPLLPMKLLKFSIDMGSMRLKTTSKHLVDTLLLLRDYLLASILSIGIANLYLQSMTLKRDGLSTQPQARMNYKLNTTQELTSLSYLCWEVTLWMMEDVLLIGTLLSQEINQILSEDLVFWHFMTTVSKYGNLVFMKN